MISLNSCKQDDDASVATGSLALSFDALSFNDEDGRIESDIPAKIAISLYDYAGNELFDRNFQGKIDEVRFYSRAIDADEIAYLACD